MKRLLSGVIALTLTATTATAFADEPAAPVATTAPDKPSAPPAATTTAADPVAPPRPAATHPPAPPPAPVPAKPVAAAPAAPPPAAEPPPAPAPVPAPVPVPAPAPAPVVAPAPSGTPLHVAPTAQPLQLAPQSEGLGWGYKILAILAVAGAVVLYLKKKKGSAARGAVAPSTIDILGKSSVGVRSQLIVVEVEGTRLLIGMTPTSISTLAVLQTPDDDVQPSSSQGPSSSQLTTAGALAGLAERADRVEQGAFRPANLGDRVRSLLGSDEPALPRLSAVKAASAKPRPRPTRPSTTRPKTGNGDSREVAGQARGLLLSDDEDS